jgi:hypothetical protein
MESCHLTNKCPDGTVSVTVRELVSAMKNGTVYVWDAALSIE